MTNLILTVTRSCNLRCSYCPTAKHGWPTLTPDDARRALSLFERYGGGDVKLFGGEPLLAPDTVRATLDETHRRACVRWVYLSTNGLELDAAWLAYLKAHPKVIVTVSLDGSARDNRRFRRALPGVPDAYDHLLRIREGLFQIPRVVVTQTIAPAAATNMLANFEHLFSLGFCRFNFLPGYYLPWSERQLAELRAGFRAIAARVAELWALGQRLYVRNLFTWAPTPFFNDGLVVDADRSIHSSNVGLAGALDGLRTETRLGDLDHPPAIELLRESAARTTALLEGRLAPAVWQNTLRVDRELTRFCRLLYPAYVDAYKRRRAA